MCDASVMLEDPPDGLSTCIVLPGGHDDMHRVMVWEMASLRVDGAAAVMMPLFGRSARLVGHEPDGERSTHGPFAADSGAGIA